MKKRAFSLRLRLSVLWWPEVYSYTKTTTPYSGMAMAATTWVAVWAGIGEWVS